MGSMLSSLYWIKSYQPPWKPHKTTSNTETKAKTKLNSSQAGIVLVKQRHLGVRVLINGEQRLLLKQEHHGYPLSGPEKYKRSHPSVPVTWRHQKLFYQKR